MAFSADQDVAVAQVADSGDWVPAPGVANEIW
jgi:hypothetical protein